MAAVLSLQQKWGLLSQVFLLSLISYYSTLGAVFTSRYNPRVSFECSLRKELDDVCQVNSRLGSAANGYKGLRMFLGESNCTVKIEQCRKGTCYSFRDLTTQLPADAGESRMPGFFKSIQVLSGADRVKHTREGFAFKTSARSVTIMYSTQTCAEFYRYRGGVDIQNCHQPVEAITVSHSITLSTTLNNHKPRAAN